MLTQKNSYIYECGFALLRGWGREDFCVCVFALIFWGVWKWGGGRLGGIGVCLFVLVLMQLVSTKDRIDSYFSQLGFV